MIPVYTSTGPGPDAADGRDGERVLRLVRIHRDTGQVATNQYDSGALQEEYRHHQADFPSIAKVITKRSFAAQPSTTSASSCPRRSSSRGRDARPVHIDVPYDLWIRTADVEVPEPEERSQMLNWRTPGSPEAVARASRC